MTILILAMCLAAPLAEAQSRPAGQKPTGPRYVAVFDFDSPQQGDRGGQLADSVRLRLRRHEEFDVIDRLTMAELTPQPGVSLATGDDSVAVLLAQKLGAQVGIFGNVQPFGAGVRAEVRCLDVSGPEPVAWTKVFSDDTERARGEVARMIVEAIRQRPEWKPPEYGDEAEPTDFGKPLNVNGGFDAGAAGWQQADNVSNMLVPDPRVGRAGKVLRIFTDLDREAWLSYQKDLRLGKADPANPPEIGTVANKYATVAGLEGVHFRSEWIEATPHRRYWLTADMTGRTAGIFFPKIFVKGFADFSQRAEAISEVALDELGLTPDQFAAMPADKQKELIAAEAKAHPERYRREVYRWYLACRNEDAAWRHYAAPFPPRGGLPENVQWLRVEVYAYWPPGEYLFDDVHLYKDPRQTAPQPEEKPRTPSCRPPSTQPASTPAH